MVRLEVGDTVELRPPAEHGGVVFDARVDKSLGWGELLKISTPYGDALVVMKPSGDYWYIDKPENLPDADSQGSD